MMRKTMANMLAMLVGLSSRLGASLSGTQRVNGSGNVGVGLGLMAEPESDPSEVIMSVHRLPKL